MLTTSHIRILAEESRFFVHQLHQRLLRKSHDEALSPAQILDTDSRAAESAGAWRERSEYLRTRLRRTPYWMRGHLLLGETALEMNDVATGYACANAVAALSRGEPSIASQKLLGRCYLKRGAFAEASAIFEKLMLHAPQDYSLTEDLAASFMGAGNYRRAREILDRIPHDRISAPGKAALLYAQKKTEAEQ